MKPGPDLCPLYTRSFLTHILFFMNSIHVTAPKRLTAVTAQSQQLRLTLTPEKFGGFFFASLSLFGQGSFIPFFVKKVVGERNKKHSNY